MTLLGTTGKEKESKMKARCLLVSAAVAMDHFMEGGVGMEVLRIGTKYMAVGIVAMVMIINVVVVLVHTMVVVAEEEAEVDEIVDIPIATT
mmetsp:Transcript_27682/g.64997  ORF Transcript_27682/g.64997 Transcript_27682/m.64997 type:complete len:91 (+) Transcript_27682:54-326(+)